MTYSSYPTIPTFNSNEDIIPSNNFLNDPILLYAHKYGLEIIENTLTLPLGEGKYRKTYVYNASAQTIMRHDVHGYAHFNEKNILNRNNEKLRLLYELKKLYFKKSELSFTNDLETGDFIFDDLFVKEPDPKIKLLEEKLKSISNVIEIFEKQINNYGSCFGQQMDNCATLLTNLIESRKKSTELEFKERISNVSQNSKLERVAKEKQKLMAHILGILENNNFEDIQESFNEFDDLRQQNSDEYFSDFIRNVEQALLIFRKVHIEKELNKTKLIEAQIREKERELKAVRENVRKGCQTSDSNEQRLKTLLKVQGMKTKHLCKTGLARSKEQSMNTAFKKKLRHCPYNIEKEKDDVVTLLTTINKEFQRVEKHKIDLIKLSKKLTFTNENYCPLLKEELYLVLLMQQKLKTSLQNVKRIIAEQHRQKERICTEIQNIDGGIRVLVEQIKRKYDKLRTHLDAIEELKTEIEELQNQKRAVQTEEMNKFEGTVFVSAGGRQNVDPNQEFHNHEDCTQLVAQHGAGCCRYKKATDKTIKFAIEQINVGLDETALFKHLRGYIHSATTEEGERANNWGDGRHAAGLKTAARKVFKEYDEVNQRISRRENDLQIRIEERKSRLKTNEEKRNHLSDEIVNQENDLNTSRINLLKEKKKERDISDQIQRNENIEECIETFQQKAEKLKSKLDEKLETEKEKSGPLKNEIADLNLNIREMYSRITKANDFIERLANCEARLVCGQVTKFLNILSTPQSLTIANNAVQAQKRELKQRLRYCEDCAKQSETELKNIEKLINENKKKSQKIINEEHEIVLKRSHLEEQTSMGLVNSIIAHRTEIELLQKQIQAELKKLDREKAEIIKREVFKNITTGQLGITCLKDGETPEDLGETNRLFKKRKFKNCQYRFNKRRLLGCEYFDAVEKMINKLLANLNDSFDNIFNEIGSTYTHCKENHKADLRTAFTIVERAISEFDKRKENVEKDYQSKIDVHVKEKSKKCSMLRAKKERDGTLIIKREWNRNDESQHKAIAKSHIEAGADIIFFYENNIIYTNTESQLNRFTFNELFNKIVPSSSRSSALAKEMDDLLKISKSAEIANLSMDKSSPRKTFYAFLVEYFGKSFCKKTNEIVVSLNEQLELEITKSKCNFEIEKIKREKVQLRRQEAMFDVLLAEIQQQNTEQNEIKQKINDVDSFTLMERVCASLMEKSKNEIKVIETDIMNCTRKIEKHEFQCKSLTPSLEFFNELKERVLSSPLRFGLDQRNGCHRNCVEVPSCSYSSTVAQLIDYYYRSTERKQHSTILLKFLNGMTHFVNFHTSDLKEILSFIDVEIEKETNFMISTIREKITELEWTKSFKNAQLQSKKNVIIVYLEKNLTDIRKYIDFRREASFLDEPSGNDLDPSQKELEEYKKEAFEVSLKQQVTALLNCFEILQTKLSNVEPNKRIPLIRSIRNVFGDYFPNLIIDELTERLKKELNVDSSEETPFKKLIRQKTGKMGAVKYLLNLVSGYFKKEKFYDINLDPEKVFYNKQLIDAQLQRKEAVAQVEILEKELSVIKMRRIELKLEDNVLLREELENVDICIKRIADAMKISWLKNVIVYIDDCSRNKDDYYCFDLFGRRVGVRLLEEDFSKKSMEIKEIDDIRRLNSVHEETLLLKKVCLESITRELKDERHKQQKCNFLEVQRNLFVKGMVLCGYDSFSNGVALDKIDGVISALTADSIGESPFYQMDGLNETSQNSENWIRKMRSEFDETNLSNGTTSLEMFVMDALNAEFSSDNLKIRQVNTLTKKYFSKDTDRMGKCINLIDFEGKTFFLQKRDNFGDLNSKIANVMSILSMDEDLFKNLALKRIDTHLRIKLQESQRLQDDYNLEVMNLSKIKRLKDFNSLFANNLDNPDAENSSSIYFLMHLEELDSARNNEVETIERCGMVKDLYKNALKKIFTEEKQRRRRKNDHVAAEKTKEELFLTEVLGDEEQELDELSKEIFCVEQDIEKVSDKRNSLLLEKEKLRNLFSEKREKLSNAIRNIEEKIRACQEKIRMINKEQLENDKSFADGQAEIARLEIQIEEIEKEIEIKKAIKERLETELRELVEQEKELAAELERINSAKERKEKELTEKSNEIAVTEFFAKFLQNLWLVIATNEFYENKNVILSAVYGKTLNSFICELNKKLVEIECDGENLWNKLINEINFETLKEYVAQGKEIGGESQQDSLHRLNVVLRTALNTDSDLVKEFSRGKSVNKFKIVATNISSKEIRDKIRKSMEKEISYSENGGGLRFTKTFSNDVLYCEEYGVTGIGELSATLKNLIDRKIELKCRSEEVQSKKSGKFKCAAEVINSLQIKYIEVVRLHIDEIEVIASGTFFLNESMLYPGIDITIGAVNMECVGDDLHIDTSGSDGESFVHDASAGTLRRHHQNQPRGDKGFDGFDGNHGGNAGNIVIKVENSIKNREGLKSIKANGGNGAEGQLGGDGDEGMKGANGKNGKASNTSWFGGGQTTIGFGSPGQPGGRGGDCGDSGRPGEAGAAGTINIVHKGVEITSVERNPGRTAKNVLERKCPKGGEGGEPGLYGMDEVKDKKSFFNKTKTVYTIVDREHLIKENPTFKNDIEDGGNIKKKDSWKGLLKYGAVGVAEGTLLGVATGGGVPGAVVGGALGGITGMVCYKFRNKRIGYTEAEDNGQYRNRDRNKNNRRGQKNKTEAKLRGDEKTLQGEKRDAVNSDTLNSKMSEKTSTDKESSGEKGLAEQISDFVLEREQLEFEIENYTQDAANIESERENVMLAKVTKVSELEKIQEELASLERRETSLNASRIASVNQVLRALEKSQNLRDQKEMTELQLNELMETIKNYQDLQKELHDNRNDHFRIIDDYIDAIRGDLDRLRLYLRMLKADYSKKLMTVKDLKKRCEDLKSERVNNTEIEVELEEEVEQEVEIKVEQEIKNEIEFDHKRKIPTQYLQVDPLGKLNVSATKSQENDIECLRLNTVKKLRARFDESNLLVHDNLKKEVEVLIELFEKPEMFYSDSFNNPNLTNLANATLSSVVVKKIKSKAIVIQIFKILSKFYKIHDKLSSDGISSNPLKILTLKLILYVNSPSPNKSTNLKTTQIVDDYLKL